MNSYVKNRSTTLLVLSWIFILALFSDGANLTDLFPGTTTIHFDEVDGSQDYDQFLATTNPPILAFSFARVVQKSEVSKQQPTSFKRVILDQDSPSLAATSIIATELSSLCPQKENAHCQPVLSTELLYLENHSFLL